MGYRYLLTLAICSAALAAEESKVTRENGFWVQTVTGVETAAPGGRLRISARGAVTLRGGAESQVRYTIVKRVKATNEREAQRRLSRFLMRAYRQGDTTFLTVQHGGDGWGSADLSVTAPGELHETIVDTYGGTVDASDLNGALQVQTGGGVIKLDRISGPVVARTAGGPITLGTLGGSAHCASAGGPIHADSIRGEAWLETAGGDITAGEVGGPLHASTAGGGVHVTRAGAAVSIDAAGGAIEVGSARGMVTAQSSSGAIRIGGAHGVRCDTGGGAIRLSHVSGGLRATTAVGDLIAQLLPSRDRQGADEDSFLVTGLGDITVFVPSNLGIRILAQIESAPNAKRIVSDFPGVKVRMDGATAVAEGPINGGGPQLHLSSSGGMIYIRREK